MTIHTTPLYGIAWCDSDSPLIDLATASQAAAETTDAALQRGGIVPPTAADLAAEVGARQAADTALSNRVTAIEPGAWVNLSLASAFAAYNAAAYGTPGYRVLGKRVWLRGWITNAGAVAANAPILTAVLPAAVRPPAGLTATLWPITDTAAPRRFQIDSTGLVITNTALTAGTFLNLDAVSWMLA